MSTEKISLDGISDFLNRDELKSIIAGGSGSGGFHGDVCCWTNENGETECLFCDIGCAFENDSASCL